MVGRTWLTHSGDNGILTGNTLPSMEQFLMVGSQALWQVDEEMVALSAIF